MGMTRSFYFIVNRGFTKEQILRKLSRVSSKGYGAAAVHAAGQDIVDRLSAIAAAGTSSMAREMADLSRKVAAIHQKLEEEDGYGGLLDMAGGGDAVEPAVAYREDARLLPCFDWKLCEGHTASARDAELLGQIFGAPVISFAVMDSDALMVSYSNPGTGIRADYARANRPGMEDELFDMDVYRPDFPEFLWEYCDEADRGKLREIWESQDYTFAEEKMEDIGGLLGIDFLYERDDVPEGYEALEAE